MAEVSEAGMNYLRVLTMAIGALRVCLDCGAVYTPNVLPGGRMRKHKHGVAG